MHRVFRIADWPLTWKVLALLVLVSTVPLAASTWFTYRDALQQSRKDAESLLAARSEQIGGQIDAFHRLYLGTVERLGRSLTVREYVETRASGDTVRRERTLALLASFVETDPQVHSAAIIGRNGEILADTQAWAVGRNVGFRTYVSEGLAGRRGVADPFVTIAPVGDETVLAYYGPARDARGEVIAVVVVYVRSETLGTQLRQVHGLAGRGSRVVLYDSVGIRIGHSAPGPVEFRPAGPLHPEVIEALAADRRFGERTRELLDRPSDVPEERERVFGPPDRRPFLEADAATGEPLLGVALRLQVTPWTLFTFVPLASVESPSARLVGKSLLLGVLLMAAALTLGLLLAIWILRPVRPLTEALDRVAVGDLGARVDIRRDDALGRLGAGFNRMTEALASSRDELEHRVEERTRDLAAALEELEAKNREVERATRLKSEFLANMSHELRTPLNSVIGFSELLGENLEGKVPDEQLRQLREIHASGRYLLGLINDVLDLARIEAGRLTLDLEDVDVLVAARDAVRVMEPAARLRRVELRVEVETERAAVADQRRLRQILLNLLANAVKFSPPGEVVQLVVRDADADLRFEVRDHGPGIDPDTVEEIFLPFVQGESPLVKTHEGAGLGLAIVRSLVEEHRGRVGVGTAPGRGATFWFTLPAAQPAVSAPSAEKGSQAGAARADLGTREVDGAASLEPRRPKAVLVVDDHDANRELAKALVERLGYRARVAPGAAEALESIRRDPPDLILMDLAMPGLTGFDVARALKVEPSTAAIPLVAFTALAMPPDRKRASEAGFDDYLVKPVDRDALAAVLRRHLGEAA